MRSAHGQLADGAALASPAVIDLRLLRDDPDHVRPALRRRGVADDDLDTLVQLDVRRRELIVEGDELRARQRQLGKAIGGAPADERASLIAETKAVSARLGALEPAQAEVEERLRAHLDVIPNLPHPAAPDGVADEDAVEVGTFGERPSAPDGGAKDHVDLGEALGILDVERAVKIAGSRFVLLKGDGVWLELALVRYALGVLERHGFEPVIPPVLSRGESLYGTAFLPTGGEQLYRIPEDDLYLVGTAEVPLAGMHRDEILPLESLPLRYAGFSTCFRREAGSYGRDTRGMFRVHQFDKVEMFSYVVPDDSWDEHERLRDVQVEVLGGLGLHGRVVDIAVGDLGASAARKYDCEVWLPGQAAYRELTSASNCTDYQARRLQCRYRTADGGTELVHTLNGTACAVGRTIIAVLETHQRADGTVAVPEALQPLLGKEVLTPAGAR